ncbi:MAG TPA: nucleotide exchange factor GrpE [Anaerolineales bacterium]|nr:nucleotide exchange factor GrpE [Anaerolineales bacterium]HRF50334.1 nucleotide exchange factor GrpE [Anaerolineales bacterium]
MTDETLQTPEPDGEAPPAQAEDLGRLVQSLQLELGEVKAKSAEYLDGWQRARAEFTNYKKRQERDQIEQYHTTLARVLQRYLEVSDDLERALKARPTEGEGATWAEGVAAIQRKLLGFLEAEGVTPVLAEGQPFDPNFHEAVVQESHDSIPSGHVVEVLRPGYKVKDRVLRTALVKVAA